MRLFIKYFLVVSALIVLSPSFAQTSPSIGDSECKKGETIRIHGTDRTCIGPKNPTGECLNGKANANACTSASDNHVWFGFPMCVCTTIDPPIIESPNPEPDEPN